MTTESRLEIEVKIKVEALAPWRQKIILLPARPAAERSFEKNIVFDTAQGFLKKQGILLRLRQYGARSLLTMKMPAQGSTAYKIREETEVDISGFADLVKILSTIGFQEFFVYEKYREVFQAQHAQVMLDETPIGNFIEIEGLPEQIDSLAARLGFTPGDYITDSYYRLFLKSGGSGNMVFNR